MDATDYRFRVRSSLPGSRVMVDPRVGMQFRVPRHGVVQLVGFRAHGMLVEAWDGVQMLTMPIRWFVDHAHSVGLAEEEN